MTFPLTKPNEGSTGWGAAVNANFAYLELLLSGVMSVPSLTMGGDLDMALNELLNVEDIDLTGAGTNFYGDLDGRYYTQEEIHELFAGLLFNYWLSDTADGGIGAYNVMYPADPQEVTSTVGPITVDADPKLIKGFITEIGEPTFTILSEGIYNLDIHASATQGANIKDARIYYELYTRTHPAGDETLRITSEPTNVLSLGEVHYVMHGILTEEVTVATTDRLVLKIYATREGAEPANPDVTIYMEGTTGSRIGVRTTLTAFDERYLLLKGGNEMAADLEMGGNMIVGVGDVDGVDVSALAVDVNGFPDELKNLLTAEIQQLENIGATTISAAQWTWLGSLANLVGLTEAEALQLVNINATTISAVQWGYLGAQTGLSGMTDRGDPAGFDFTLVDFTTDGTWRDIDLSGIIPAGAKTAACHLIVRADVAGAQATFRKNGNSNTINTSSVRSQAIGIYNDDDIIIPLDGDRKAEYLLENVAWTRCYLTVKGWWF